jgi:tetratricopeptide (TPR) repeat protein
MALREAQRVARFEKWREPPDHHFAIQWGLLYQQKKDFRRAELWFRRSVAFRPSGSNLTRLAETLTMRGQLAAAKHYLTRAIRTDSGDPGVAYYHLGLIARARREYGTALKNLNEAIRRSPAYPLARKARRDVERAMKVIGIPLK